MRYGVIFDKPPRQCRYVYECHAAITRFNMALATVLVVGIGVACIAIYGGIEILRDAHMDIHEEEGTEHEGWRK